jgi:hypothetical protein
LKQDANDDNQFLAFILVGECTDNPNTTQTPEYTKDKYNVKIIKQKVSPKVSSTTYVGRRVKGRRSLNG